MIDMAMMPQYPTSQNNQELLTKNSMFRLLLQRYYQECLQVNGITFFVLHRLVSSYKVIVIADLEIKVNPIVEKLKKIDSPCCSHHPEPRRKRKTQM
jgi:hypothetical protein